MDTLFHKHRKRRVWKWMGTSFTERNTVSNEGYAPSQTVVPAMGTPFTERNTDSSDQGMLPNKHRRQWFWLRAHPLLNATPSEEHNTSSSDGNALSKTQ